MSKTNIAGTALLMAIILIAIFAIAAIYPGWEGEPHENLLNFTCADLEHADISTDGPDGKFVTDEVSSNWVKDKLIKDAQLAKGCVKPNPLMDKFDYQYEGELE